MCGIFGMATNSPNKINDAKVKILGLYNESRGKNSCGITYDGEIYHGLDKEALVSNFFKHKVFKPTEFPYIFGHTRQSSVGAVNHYNAHPFGYGENNINQGYETTFCHNGTLLNHKELAKKYNVNTPVKAAGVFNPNIEIDREKIDSEILGEILHETKNFKVLSEYNGRAALVWVNNNEPNIIYLFSGKSVPTKGTNWDKFAEEERPLNVYVESKNTFYFSSLKDPLYIIGGNIDNVFQIDYNTVYIVKDGDFKKAKKISVSRQQNYNTADYTNYGSRGSFRGYGYNSAWEDFDDYDSPYINNAFPKKETAVINLPSKTITNKVSIYDDKPVFDENSYKGKIYTKKLRYYKNGHLIKGIYTYIPGYNFYYLGDTLKQAEQTYDFLVGKQFNPELGEFDVKSELVKGSFDIPFKSIPDKYVLFYFVEGILLKDQKDYLALQYNEALFKKGHFLDYIKLSHSSMYPIIEIAVSKKDVDKQGIYHNGVLHTGTITGLKFEKEYIVKNGNLVETKVISHNTNSKVKENSREFDVKVYDNSKRFIKEFETELLRQEFEESLSDITEQNDDKFYNELEQIIYTSEEVEKKINELVEDYLDNPTVEFDEFKQTLESFLPHTAAIEAIELVDSMFNLIQKFIK